MASNHLYTLDLGETYGPKLDRLAALASYDDVEAFAAMILRDGLDRLEEDQAQELARLAQKPPKPEEQADLPV